MMHEPQSSGHARVAVGAGKAPRRAQSKLARATFWPLVLVFLLADVILVQGAMTVVLGQGERLAWFASASLAFLAAYAAYEAPDQHGAHPWLHVWEYKWAHAFRGKAKH